MTWTAPVPPVRSGCAGPLDESDEGQREKKHALHHHKDTIAFGMMSGTSRARP